MGRLFIIDSKEAGTDGGDFTSGDWRKRILNTIVYNTISGSSLSDSQITLPAGTYYMRASAPAYSVGAHQTRLYDVTGDSMITEGSSEYTPTDSGVANRSFLLSFFTIAAQKVFEFQHMCESTKNTVGMGHAAGYESEIYAIVEIIEIV
jgi:hypothetical protein